MDIQEEARRHYPDIREIRDVLERLRHKFRHAITVITSYRQAQTQRRIQLYLDGRLIDEFAEVGRRIARKDK